MEDDPVDDAIGAALSSRRIPHGRSGKKGKGGTGYGSSHFNFDPLRARGRYEISLGSGKKQQIQSDGAVRDSWMEIHELTPDRDALIGTFSFRGQEQGMCVLAGSRKGLSQAVRNLEAASEGEDDDGGDTNQGEEGDGNGGEHDSADSDHQKHEVQDSRDAFEKNTFRTPKFWMTWRSNSLDSTSEAGLKRSAYLVFSGNDCQRIEGTITSTAMNWNNLKLRGRKLHSKPSPCPLVWSELT